MILEDRNFRAFNSSAVVEHYAKLSGLQPAELYMFEKFVPKGASILDVGVGGGRTTPYLAAKATRYVGVDYVQAMIDTCATKFPEHAFYRADAARLSMLEDASFEIVVFSFNGIDAIATKEDRLRCIAEVFRVLVPNGLFIFSSHNARGLLNVPSFDGAGPLRKVWRLVRSLAKNLPLVIQLLSSGAFFAGEGYYLDPAHGGIRGYSSIPDLIKRDLCAVGFQLREIVGSTYPRIVSHYYTPWYYYVFAKEL